ncbi:MAG: NAD-dependent epimerase/dehydratase family protein [Anaerolineae bacterium]|nr:NAD-dependent epimerase/dehydratase family protein [Anaerolineae bacterium]
MRVLIVGGTGLISTGITRQLVARGDDVTLFNRGLREVELPPVGRMVGDRNDSGAFEEQMARAGTFDAVIDMVCFRPEHAESAIRAFRGRTSQYVFCSTVDVYTKPAPSYPIREGAPREPSSTFPYAFDKAKCERLFQDAHERGELIVTILRPAWTYGERGSVLHTFGWDPYYLARLRRGEPVIVHGDGTSLWAACHRDDVARAFVGAVGNPRTHGQAYHVTGDEWLTWNAYHRIVAAALGAGRPELVHIPTDLLGRVVPQAAMWCVENFSHNNVFDNGAARRDLGFSYTVRFSEGVRRVIDWLDARGAIDGAETPPFYERVLRAWQQLGDAMVDALAEGGGGSSGGSSDRQSNTRGVSHGRRVGRTQRKAV